MNRSDNYNLTEAISHIFLITDPPSCLVSFISSSFQNGPQRKLSNMPRDEMCIDKPIHYVIKPETVHPSASFSKHPSSPAYQRHPHHPNILLLPLS